MGWGIGCDGDRDIGYDVPCFCDHPDCRQEINRGLSYVCGSDPKGGSYGCGSYFCPGHLTIKEVENKRTIQASGEEEICIQLCTRCFAGKEAYPERPDTATWIYWKLTDVSWQEWREENMDEVEKLTELVGPLDSGYEPEELTVSNVKILPKRIQLKRTKGFNLQSVSKALNGLAAVKVARPSKWGNPYVIGAKMETLGGTMLLDRGWCLWQFRQHARNTLKTSEIIKGLRGKNLACFCPLDQDCHGDILLEIANSPES